MRGFAERSIRNSDRWKAYHKRLILKYDIGYLYIIRRVSWWALAISSALVVLTGSNSVIPCLIALPLSVSQLIICYYVFITPFPDELLLEPPAFFEKIYKKPLINRILVRHYSSRKGASAAFTGGSKIAWYLAIGTSAAVSSAVSADVGLSTLTGEVTYIGRAYDRSKYGWYTESPGAREKMRVLEAAGFEKSDFINSDGRLNYVKVHRFYNEWESAWTEREAALEERLTQQENEIKSQRDEIKSQRDEIKSQRDEIKLLSDRLENYEKETSIK